MINTAEVLIVNVAGVLILVLSLLSRYGDNREKHFDDHLFDTMIGIVMGALVMETLSFALVHTLQYVINAYLFLASCGVGALWVLYVDYRIYRSIKRVHKWMIQVVTAFALIAVLIFCDLFGAGIIFSITEENIYLRGRLVVLPYILLIYDYCASLVLAILAVKQRNHVQFFPIWHFVLPCVCGTVIQGLNYGLSVGWFCVSLAFVFIQMQLIKRDAFEDDLSGLFNRKFYHYVIRKLVGSRKSEMVSGIMMDVNHFKNINDQFGHTTGDDAIREIGKIISSVTTERDMAFRHAGDEFVIISTVESEQDVVRLMDAITQKVAQWNADSRKPYQLSLAMGYTVCKISELDSDRFLHQMDIKMYEAKAKYYAQAGKDRRSNPKR